MKQSDAEIIAQIWGRAVTCGELQCRGQLAGSVWQLDLGDWQVWLNGTAKSNWLPHRPEAVPAAALYAEYQCQPGYVLPLREGMIRIGCSRQWLDQLNSALLRASIQCMVAKT